MTEQQRKQLKPENALVTMSDGETFQIHTNMTYGDLQKYVPHTVCSNSQKETINDPTFRLVSGEHYFLTKRPTAPAKPAEPTCGDICLAMTFNYRAPDRSTVKTISPPPRERLI